MAILIIVDNSSNWKLDIPDVEVVPSRQYLTDPKYIELRGARVFNLCKSYRYQSIGYYVSLLAEARGHRPLPSVMTVRDMKSQSLTRFVSEDVEELFQKVLKDVDEPEFTIHVYFGRTEEKRFEKLGPALYGLFQAPMMCASFKKDEEGKWHLVEVAAIPASQISKEKQAFVEKVAKEFFTGKKIHIPKRSASRYDLAILWNPKEQSPPSNEKALQKFVKIGESLGIDVELITRDDYARLSEFDALFMRETTYVNHYTYRFARRAAADGLVVIDDPATIVRCTNKVYHAELFKRNKIPTPKTIVGHRDNIAEIIPAVGLPCILKPPDGSFSKGMSKVNSEEELLKATEEILKTSELFIAQEFTPTEYDWRIGIIDRKPLYACKYHMAPKHWQIIKDSGSGNESFGKVETVPVEMAPRKVVKAAVEAANLIGEGLYGVDMKEFNGKPMVIEVNDNPNIDAGYEDVVLKDDLYTKILEVFIKRIEQRRRGS
ncbi:MAG: RimK family protein [Bacteroidota bacterium]